MAVTASTGFRYLRSLGGNEAAPTPVLIRIANSTTLRVGDVVRVNTSGLLVTAGTNNPAAGVLVGFVDQNGIGPWSFGYSGAGTTLVGDDTLTTASDNSTRAQYIMGQVVLDPAGDILWLTDSDADLAQTNLFQYCDLDANGRQAVMSSPSDATGMVQLIVLDPEASGGAPADASKGAFRITRNQFGLLVDSATAKVAA